MGGERTVQRVETYDAASERHVYRPRWYRSRGARFLLASLILIDIAVLTLGLVLGQRLIIVDTAFNLLVAALYLPLMRQYLLIVAADGIRYRTPGWTLHAAWEDVRGIGRRPGLNRYGEVGLLLRTVPRQRRMPWTRALPGFIPLRNITGPYWERGLFDDLRLHVPWLVEDDEGA